MRTERRPAGFRLHLEPLEDRQLLSGSGPAVLPTLGLDVAPGLATDWAAQPNPGMPTESGSQVAAKSPPRQLSSADAPPGTGQSVAVADSGKSMPKDAMPGDAVAGKVGAVSENYSTNDPTPDDLGSADTSASAQPSYLELLAYKGTRIDSGATSIEAAAVRDLEQESAAKQPQPIAPSAVAANTTLPDDSAKIPAQARAPEVIPQASKRADTTTTPVYHAATAPTSQTTESSDGLSLLAAVVAGNSKDVPGRIGEEPADSLTRGDLCRAATHAGELLVGALPLDLPTLKRATDEFFTNLDELAEQMTSAPPTLRLTQWLFAVAAAAGAFEYTRRRRANTDARGRASAEGENDPSWISSPAFAFLPAKSVP
jgi:hypothetical protein